MKKFLSIWPLTNWVELFCSLGAGELRHIVDAVDHSDEKIELSWQTNEKEERKERNSQDEQYTYFY